MGLEEYSTTIILCVGSALTLITGYWFYFDPPKKINSFYGFRTKKSVKSQEQWDFAHRFSGKQFIFFGIILLIASIFVGLLDFNNDLANIFAIIFFVIGAFLIIYRTEKAIDKEFKG